jgi:hypothetical protein
MISDSNGPDPRVLELYKTAVEMADRISARRSTANAFFLTAQTALVAVIGLTTPNLLKAPWWTALAVAIAGVVLSASWWLQLRSYRDLNRAKFNVINSIEQKLPIKIFSDEWDFLKKDSTKSWRTRYTELGTVERFVPGIFALLYILLFLGRAVS